MNVLFDLDGTLTDPALGFVNCIRYSFEKLNIPLKVDSNISSYIGPPLEQTMANILGKEDRSRVDQAVSFYRERYGVEGIVENTVYDGIPEALNNLKNSDVTMYLATSKPRVFAEKILERFELAQYFYAIYGSELDGSLADKKALISHIIQRECLSADETIMVGDRKYDAVGAFANAIPALGVLWGYGSMQELTEAGVKHLSESPAELVADISTLRIDR